MAIAEQLTGQVTHHGEGAIWDAASGVLHFVDLTGGDLLSRTDDGVITRQHVGTIAAAWRPRTRGGGVLGVERGFALLDEDHNLQTLPEVWSDPRIRMNDGSCDPQGRFYCGTMAYDETPGAGTVYRLDPDGSVTSVLSGVTISNGMIWSLDGESVYYIDTPTHQVVQFDFDAGAGTLHDPRPVIEVPDAGPDGMTIDAEGQLWVAQWGGSAVHCYSASGELLEVVEVAATQVSCCGFGGPDLDTLYITTSRQGLADGEQPGAGALFAIQPGVRGVAVLPYGG